MTRLRQPPRDLLVLVLVLALALLLSSRSTAQAAEEPEAFARVVVESADLSSLRREKDDVTEVREGFECGLVIRGFNDIKQGDVVEAFEMREIPRS